MPENTDTFFGKYVNFMIHVNDKWKPVPLAGKEKYHFLLPMTYINPSYLAVGFLTVVSALSNTGHRVSILLHDVNLLAHMQSRREMLSKGYISINTYIEYILEEIETILKSLQANFDNIRIIRVSDVWSAMSQDNLEFFTFYSLLGEIRFDRSIEDSDKFYHTAYHAIQRPFDIFFAKHYTKLYLTDWGNPNFIIIPLDRHASYVYIRNKIMNSPPLSTQYIQSPLFCTIRPSFVFSYRDSMPTCGMTIQEIENIILKSKPTAEDMRLTLSNVVLPIARFLNAIGIMKELVALPEKPTEHEVAVCLHSVLDSLWEKAKAYQESGKSNIYITSRLKFNEIEEILSSKAIVKTLLYCDGNSSVSDIAKRANQQLSNTSHYVSKLRKVGLVTSGPKPKIRFEKIVLDAKALFAGHEASGL